MRQSRGKYHKTRQKAFLVKVVLFLILFLGLASASIYFFIFSPFFRIKEIIISGNQEIASSQVQDIVRRNIEGKKFWLLPKDNVFLLKTENLSADLKNNFVEIYEVKIGTRVKQKFWPTTLHISFFKRQPKAVVCHYHYEPCGRGLINQAPTEVETQQCRVSTGSTEIFDDCFYVDQQGIAFKPAPQTQGSLILLAAANYDISLGWEAAKPHLIKAMAQIKKAISEKISDVLVNHFLIISDQEIHLKTQAGWQIYFDTTGDFNYQTEVLKELLGQKIKETKNLDYIDLRLGDKVYYKNKE